MGLSEKLPVQSLIVGAIRVRSIALKSWFRYLLNVRNGGQLFGGFSPWDGFASLCLKSFWEAFRKERPQHAVFELHNAHLHRCVPYCIHLDEGRGLRKSAVLVIHFQSIFGADTAPNFRADFAFSWQDHLGQEEASEIMLRNQFHNARGALSSAECFTLFCPRPPTQNVIAMSLLLFSRTCGKSAQRCLKTAFCLMMAASIMVPS